MNRTLACVSAAALVLLLTACGSGTPPVAETTPAVTPSTSATPTAEPTMEPTPAAFVLPTCAELFTRAEIDSLMGEALEPLESVANPGTALPVVQAQLRDINPLNCGWSIPALERGVVVSLARPGDTSAVRSYLESLGVLPRETGLGSAYSSQGLDTLHYTETQLFGAEIWVAVFDGSGTASEAIALRAAERVAELNP